MEELQKKQNILYSNLIDLLRSFLAQKTDEFTKELSKNKNSIEAEQNQNKA